MLVRMVISDYFKNERDKVCENMFLFCPAAATSTLTATLILR